MSRTDRERLGDAALYFDVAANYAATSPLDQRSIDAICMRLAAGIEALNGLPDDVRTALFGDTWRAMWGMRNRIAHTYARVEHDVVLATVRVDVPNIQARIARYLAADAKRIGDPEREAFLKAARARRPG